MITRFKGWFNGLSDQWKATLRTALQNVLGALSLFVIGMIGSLTNILNGQAVDLVADINNYARISGIAMLGAASAVWAFIMNRSSVTNKASFPPSPPA